MTNILITNQSKVDYAKYAKEIIESDIEVKCEPFVRDVNIPMCGSSSKLESYKKKILDLYNKVNPSLSYETHDIFFTNSGTQAVHAVYDCVFSKGGSVVFPLNESHDSHINYFEKHKNIKVIDLLSIPRKRIGDVTAISGVTLSNGSGLRLVHDYQQQLQSLCNPDTITILDSVHEIVFIPNRDYRKTDFIITTSHAFGGDEGTAWFVYRRDPKIQALVSTIKTSDFYIKDYSAKLDSAINQLTRFVHNRLMSNEIWSRFRKIIIEISTQLGFEIEDYVDKFLLDDYGSFYDELLEKKIQRVNYAFNLTLDGKPIKPFEQYKSQIQTICISFRLPRFVNETQSEVDKTFIYFANRLKQIKSEM